MADIVVYEDSPLAQYLQDIQEEQHGPDLQHSPVPIHEPGPKPDSMSKRMADNAMGMLTHLMEYLTHTFSPSASDAEDAEFEERFKYLICTSPFLNKAATLHTHERGRRTDALLPIEYAANFSPGPFGYLLGVGTIATLIARSALARTRVGRNPLLRPLLSRATAIVLTIISSAWMLRILYRRKLRTTQNQALRSLQLLVNECQSLDGKVNRAIMVIQEIELVSRGYRLSTPLAPISRIEQASKSRRCNIVRAQLIAALTKSGALFQKSTETLQSHIDHNRLSTLLDMYNITPSSRPNSPGYMDGAGNSGPYNTGKFASPDSRLAKLTIETQSANNINLANDSLPLIASPISDTHTPLPSHYAHHARQHSSSKRRSRTLTGGSNRSRPSSYHEPSLNSPLINAEQQRFLSFGRRPSRRHHTSWSASEGEESDSGSLPMVSPRSSIYSNVDTNDGSSPSASSPEMTSLERLRKNFQKMHGFRREFLCELLSIRRKSRKGHQGLHHALKDYDRNWTVVRDVLQEGLQGIESVVAELSKVLDTELYTLPRIDTQGNNSTSSPRDKQLQPFVQRLALLEQHVRGVQAKLYICNEDIKETVRQDSADNEKRRLLELQYESISQDIGMMVSEWQLGKTALSNIFEPPKALTTQNPDLASDLSDTQGGRLGLGLDNLDEQDGSTRLDGPLVDSMEMLEDQQRLMALSAKRIETWEASTESVTSSSSSKRLGFAVDGSMTTKMTRAERIAYQKALREQEEAKRERVYDNSKMVHELKDVLGRRRHLRENDDDDHEPNPGSSSSVPNLAPLPSLRAEVEEQGESLGYSIVAIGSLTAQDTKIDSEDGRLLSLDDELTATSSTGQVSLIPLDSSVYASGSESFMSFMESSIGPFDEPMVEISGVGVAEEIEVNEGELKAEEEESPDYKSEQGP
ncbi:hypothetical protein FBU30_007934 [Linnemannia zychae]|nr:hypothetical protein FBU30_007934 [Linnemannia zychae]